MLLAFMALVNMGFLPHLLLGKHALRSISLSLLTERWPSLHDTSALVMPPAIIPKAFPLSNLEMTAILLFNNKSQHKNIKENFDS